MATQQNTSKETSIKSAELRTSNNEAASVAVILAYYNGSQYLVDQLKSIIDQTHSSLKIFICDDCSEKKVDQEAIEDALAKPHAINVKRRERNLGYAQNFLTGIRELDESFEYTAFSDQDDCWHENKIERAIAALKKHPKNKPALYCARTNIVDETGTIGLGASPIFKKPPSFANAMVQSIGGGNTMVMNKAARDIIAKSSENIEVVSHDWWCYQIIAGAGGIVIYDSEPCLKYRQHGDNQIGANGSWKARFSRILALLQGGYRKWNDTNLAALVKNKSHLTKENKQLLDDFIKARNSKLFKRLYLFKCSGIYRQTLFGNLGLILGILLNKV